MSKRKKHKKGRKKYKPYAPVKMKFVQMPDPFGSAPLEVRRKVMTEIATKARAAFEEEYPKIINWFDTYDPLYILSFCVFYFLSTPQGVDKEAVDGKLDFAPHHLELLQAFALRGARRGTPAPLKEKAMELQQTLKRITDDLGLAQLTVLRDGMSDAEVKKHFVLHQMRSQTFAIRNWAYPDQTYTHLKALFSGSLDATLSREYDGASVVRLIDALVALAEESNVRLNAHIGRLRPAMTASSYEECYAEYQRAFQLVKDDTEAMRDVFVRMCRSDLRSFKSLLMVHSDLFLGGIFTFSLDDIMKAYGDDSHRAGVLRMIRKMSYRFGDLADADVKHFLFSNPVLVRPLIELDDGSFFWALGGILAHTLPAMLEELIPKSELPRYSDTRAKYLEDSVEARFREAFPDGRVYRGSQWKTTPGDPTQYESDVLVIIDSTAIVVECKSHLVDAPARRGAEFRLVDTLEDLVVSSSDQAQRLVDFLKEHRQVHRFNTRAGAVNEVDSTRLVRFIPISVTYENLGFVSANLKEAVEAELIEPGHALVPSICITDLEIAFEVLESQAQRIHYLARRAEVEKTMHYHGDEMDLLAFYLETGFNIGEIESGGTLIQLAMKSKELDPYFVARADGVDVPKPALSLTLWWKDILARIEEVKAEFWTEIAYIFLSADIKSQRKFERKLKQLADRVDKGALREKHNWLTFIVGTLAKRQHAVIGYPYKAQARSERNDMMKHMAADAEAKMPMSGIAVLGWNVDDINYPYNVLAYIPGHAAGAPDVSSLLDMASPETR
jgi:hypothetical protein